MLSGARSLNMTSVEEPLVGVKALIIGIAGGTCSGKTTLAMQLKKIFGDDIATINQDSYYRDISHLPMSERYAVNFDHTDALYFDLLAEHIRTLKDFNGVSIPNYDFVEGTSRENVHFIKPRRVIVVEGILLFAVPEVKNIFDIRVFVEADDDIRLLRRVNRDIRERGHDVAGVQKQYLATVKPTHDQFVVPSRTDAHVIIPGTKHSAVGLELLVARIKQELARNNAFEQRAS